MSKKYIIMLLTLVIGVGVGARVSAATLSEELSGRILLQVEDKGQAWYVEPVLDKRVFLGRPADAFNVMQKFGLGISEADYEKNKMKASASLSGKILLRVKSKGEAYYVNPLDLKLNYLGRPSDAFSLMRKLGLGISNSNLASIGVLAGYGEKIYKPAVPSLPDVETDEAGDDANVTQEVNDGVTDEIIDEMTDELIPEKELRVISLGEIQKMINTTVESSNPMFAGSVNDKALYWWDGYAAFSRFDTNGMILSRVHNFSGSSAGGLASNGTSYAIAWEKNCRVYADVIDGLGKTLDESKLLGARVGESCPTNIGLVGSNENFGLIWTATDSGGNYNLYFKMFTPKGISVNPEIIIATNTDLSVRPALSWDADHYIVVWQGIQGDEKSVQVARIDKSGQLVVSPETLLSETNALSNLELINEGASLFSLHWMENSSSGSKLKAIKFDLNIVEVEVLGDISLEQSPKAGSKFSMIKNLDKYGLAWESETDLYFLEIDSNNEINSAVQIVSDSGTNGQAELFLNKGTYGLFWHSNTDLSKAIYYRSIE